MGNKGETSGGNAYDIAGHANKLMTGVEWSELETAIVRDLKATTVYGAWRVLF